jgi:hypothetical protein
VTYRAIPRHLTLEVTGDAETHAVDVVHLEYLRHPLHVTMAGGARVRAERLYVTLMRKVSVAWEVVHPHPFDRFLLGPGLTQLLDFRLVGAIPPSDDEMATHAGLNGRDARLGRDLNRVMAVLALHLVLPGVDVMTKEDRLAGSAQATTIGSGEDGSGGGVGAGGGLLSERRISTEYYEGSDASGCNATDDECQLTNHHLTAEEEL